MKDLKEALNSPLTWIVAYLVVAIFTYGHAFNGVPKEEAGKFGGVEDRKSTRLNTSHT